MTLSWDDARRTARELARLLPADDVPLPEAIGRGLATDITARCDLPGFDTSAMDGWAVAGPGPWRVTARVLAGEAPQFRLAAGEAVEIATGAAVPAGGEAVVRSEDGQLDAAGLLTATTPVDARYLRPRGEECRAGDVLVPAGSIVTPAIAGLAAAAGLDALSVRRRPVAHLLRLGDEIVEFGVPPWGRVRDSLSPQLPAWIAALGGNCPVIRPVPDDAGLLVEALRGAGPCDLILTTGGTAAGPVDHLHRALAAVGAELVIDTVAVRPGHPMLLARLGDVPIVGLPGNPQSAVVALMTLAAPLLAAQQGLPAAELPLVRLTADATAPATENRLLLGTLGPAGFAAVNHLGSAMLRGLAAADGFAVLPPGGARAGADVPWLALPTYRSAGMPRLRPAASRPGEP